MNIPASVSFTFWISRVICLTVALRDTPSVPDTQQHQNQNPNPNPNLEAAEAGREPVQTFAGHAKSDPNHHAALVLPRQVGSVPGQPAVQLDPLARFSHKHVAISGQRAQHRQGKSCRFRQITCVCEPNRCRTYKMVNISNPPHPQ